MGFSEWVRVWVPEARVNAKLNARAGRMGNQQLRMLLDGLMGCRVGQGAMSLVVDLLPPFGVYCVRYSCSCAMAIK